MCIAIDLDKAVDYAEKVNVYNDGAISVYKFGAEEYEKIVCGWKALIADAHEMPAFGVSINAETLKALTKGVWVEFLFGCTYQSNGMPYDKLLINVEKASQGFNVIRYNAKYGYDGRCFYYDLVGKNMGNFYEILTNI